MKPNERFLTNIVSVISSSEHSDRGGRNGTLVPFDERAKGAIVTGTSQGDQFGIGAGGGHYSEGSRGIDKAEPPVIP